MATITERIKQFLNDILENRQLEKVQKDASAIQGMRNPSETIQMAAVKNDGLAIQYISKPSEAVKMAAVQSNGYAIEFISNPTEEMKIEAVKNNAYSIIEMEEPTPSVCKIALEKMYGRPINVAMVEPTELAKKTQILLNNLVGLKFEYRTVYQTYGKAAEEDPLQMSIQEKKDKFRTEMEEKYPSMFQNKTQSTQKDHNTTNLKEQELYSSETKILIGDISSKKEITNLRIKDKITGKTEPLNSNGIRLLDQPSECIEKILSGKKVEFTTNSGKGYLTGLCKTPLGWGLTIGKQIQSSTDSSATL